MKRVLTVLAMVAALGLVMGAAVAAEEEQTPTEVTIERHDGYGALWASGSGHVELDVRRAWVGLRVEGDVAIEGGVHRLVINGAESAEADSDGGTKVHLEDFSGTIFVSGAHYTVDVTGDVSLHGVGSGQATFRGEGWWRTLHRRGLWSGGDPIAIVSPS